MAAPRSRCRATSVRLPQADLDRFRAAAAVEDGGLVGPFLRRAAIRLSQAALDGRAVACAPSVTTTKGDPVVTVRIPPANEESFKSAASITDGGRFGAFIIRAGRVLAAEIEKGRR